MISKHVCILMKLCIDSEFMIFNYWFRLIQVTYIFICVLKDYIYWFTVVVEVLYK